MAELKALHHIALAIVLTVCVPSFAVTPPTRISYNDSGAPGSGASKTVTPTSGWQAGDIILVVSINEGFASETFTAPSATGLTFTNDINHTPGSNCGLRVDHAVAAGSGSGAISQTISRSASDWVMHVSVWRGSDGVGTVSSQFTTTKTVALVPGQADSAMVWGIGDWSAASVQSGTPAPTTTDRATVASGLYTNYAFQLADQASSGSTLYGLSGTSAGPFSIGVIEIKGAAGGGATASGFSKLRKLEKLNLLR
jgi:hypothetical protein